MSKAKVGRQLKYQMYKNKPLRDVITGHYLAAYEEYPELFYGFILIGRELMRKAGKSHD